MFADGGRLPYIEQTADISTVVATLHEFADVLDDDEWGFISTALAPGRLRRVAADARWRSWFVVALASGVPVGLLPLYRSKNPSFATPIFDPVRVAPELFGVASRRADEYLLIGGNTGLVSGAALAASLDHELAHRVLVMLVDTAFDHAAATGLTGAALYVRDHDIEGFRCGSAGRRAARPIGEFATLPVPGRTLEQYLSTLSRGRRSIVRRDWRWLDERGLRAVQAPAADLIEEAAPLVAEVKRRHGVPDHPALVCLRLQDWAAEPVGVRVAFAVRGANGQLLAVSFACHRGDLLEMYEIGLTDDPDVRHLAYVEVLVYAPLRYAARTGCAEIQMGLDSLTPKTLRGAVSTRVWAVGEAGALSQTSIHQQSGGEAEKVVTIF